MFKNDFFSEEILEVPHRNMLLFPMSLLITTSSQEVSHHTDILLFGFAFLFECRFIRQQEELSTVL